MMGLLVDAPGASVPLKDIAKKFVVFVLGWRDPLEGGPEELVPIGTGFFVAVPALTLPGVFNYVVTAKHVVEGERETFIRVGARGGGLKVVRVSEWTPHPTQDVAVSSLNHGERDHLDYASILVCEFFLRHHPEVRPPSLGDRVYFLGLLADIPDMAARNVPMVRSGTIGALNEELVPMRLADDTKVFVTAHLIDCRSFAGFSGSPCFVQFDDDKGELTALLGLMSGHFDKWAPARGTGDYSADYVGQVEVAVNTGVGLCTPAEMITETFNLEELLEKRARGEAEARARIERQLGATADKAEGSTATSEFEHFESLTSKLLRVSKEELDQKRGETP